MTKTVEITLELDSGLTNNTIESMFGDQFGADVVSVNAFETPETDFEQEPTPGEIVNTEWLDEENFRVDVKKGDKTFREIYSFESKELLFAED